MSFFLAFTESAHEHETLNRTIKKNVLMGVNMWIVNKSYVKTN